MECLRSRVLHSNIKSRIALPQILYALKTALNSMRILGFKLRIVLYATMNPCNFVSSALECKYSQHIKMLWHKNYTSKQQRNK